MPRDTITYPPEERPTEPDLHKSGATKCQHCGRVYEEHARIRAPGETLPSARCRGLRTQFWPGPAPER